MREELVCRIWMWKINYPMSSLSIWSHLELSCCIGWTHLVALLSRGAVHVVLVEIWILAYVAICQWFCWKYWATEPSFCVTELNNAGYLVCSCPRNRLLYRNWMCVAFPSSNEIEASKMSASFFISFQNRDAFVCCQGLTCSSPVKVAFVHHDHHYLATIATSTWLTKIC